MPRLARGFSLLSAYQKATTKTVVANFILPLILQTLCGGFFFYLGILDGVVIPRTEQKGNAPDTRQGNDGVDDAGGHGGGAAADPSNQIELEQTNATPVESADDGNNERDTIQNHHNRTYPFRGRPRRASRHSQKRTAVSRRPPSRVTDVR